MRLPVRVTLAVIFFISRLIPLRATVEIYIFESKWFFQTEKRSFYRTKLIRKRVSLYTTALTSNKIAPILFERGGGCCTQAKIAFFSHKRQTEQLKESFYKKMVWYGSGSPCIWNPTLRLSNEQVRASPGTPVLHINLPLKTLYELILALGPTPAPRLCECISGFSIGVVVAVAA